MITTERAATKNELGRKYRYLSWFEFGARRTARDEASRAVVNVSAFEVRRVWSCNLCSGPPCCPATWLIETSEDEYVQISSWESLLQSEEKFPGRRVVIAYWPLLKRIIQATAEGEPIMPEQESEEARKFGGYDQFRNVPLSEIPAELTATHSLAV